MSAAYFAKICPNGAKSATSANAAVAAIEKSECFIVISLFLIFILSFLSNKKGRGKTHGKRGRSTPTAGTGAPSADLPHLYIRRFINFHLTRFPASILLYHDFSFLSTLKRAILRPVASTYISAGLALSPDVLRRAFPERRRASLLPSFPAISRKKRFVRIQCKARSG